MSFWLVCFPATLPAEGRDAALAAAGLLAGPGPPVPLGDEVAVRIEADAAVVAALRRRSEVVAIYPDSEQTAY